MPALRNLEPLFARVQKPARYTGGAWNSTPKDWDECDVRVVWRPRRGSNQLCNNHDWCPTTTGPRQRAPSKQVVDLSRLRTFAPVELCLRWLLSIMLL
jgi:hypothetical protein